MRTYQIRQAIAVAALSMAVTVMLLEFYGYINHPRRSEDELTRFHSVLPVSGGEYRMSNQVSPHQMWCKQGFATIVTEDGSGRTLQSLLLDSRDRGIHCNLRNDGGN